MSTELKPCPFCGGEAKETEPAEVGSYWFNMWKIQCRDCGALVAGSHRRMNREAWNRRAERMCRDDGVDAFRCDRCGAFAKRGAVTDCCAAIPVRFCPNCGAKVVEL